MCWEVKIKNFGITLLLIVFLNFNAFAETQSCKRIRLDYSGFSTLKAAESWYPKNINVYTNYNTKTARLWGRDANLVIRNDKKRMDASFKIKS